MCVARLLGALQNTQFATHLSNVRRILTLVEKCRFASDLEPLFASDLGPTAQVSTQITYK